MPTRALTTDFVTEKTCRGVVRLPCQLQSSTSRPSRTTARQVERRARASEASRSRRVGWKPARAGVVVGQPSTGRGAALAPVGTTSARLVTAATTAALMPMRIGLGRGLGSAVVTTTIGVLAVQGDVREHVRTLEGLGVRATTVRRPTELEACDGMVMPGGESTTMAKLARTFELFEPLQKRIADGMPVFGTCAGMILLADRVLDGTADQETLGGLDITVRRNAFGRQVHSFEGPIEMDGLDAPVHAVFIRAPWVEEVGPEVQVLARVTEGEAAGRIV